VFLLYIATNRREIEHEQQELITRLEQHCDRRIPAKVGHKGASRECLVRWSKDLGLWFYSRKIEGRRYWNVFGLSEVAPKQNSMLSIVCEINPPVEGLDRRIGGAFARDEHGHSWLVHRGKIGGGRPGIGKKLFFRNYHGEIGEIDGDRFAIIGDTSSPDFVQRVRDFVRDVDRIKNLVV